MLPVFHLYFLTYTVGNLVLFRQRGRCITLIMPACHMAFLRCIQVSASCESKDSSALPSPICSDLQQSARLLT